MLGGKKWFESLTIWGAILLGGATTAEQIGVVQPGAVEAVVAIVEAIGGLLVILGIRRAATTPNAK